MNKNLQGIIEQIFSEPELLKDPPVLIDIGASGNIHERWKMIAPYAVCIAFDADNREMGYIEKENSGYKKLIVINSIVSDRKDSLIEFYLTRSPFCSSTLDPDLENLRNYEFAQLFEVEKKIKLNAVHLPDVLAKLNIHSIDWYKSDSQGTDLRLFKSLDQQLSKKIIVAEFEPGIIDAYKEEDKLHALMNNMDTLPFWMSSMDVKGNSRIRSDVFSSFNSEDRKKIHRSLKVSPAWAELVYFNTFESENLQTNRNLLLGWTFATLLSQHGFALQMADKLKAVRSSKLADSLKDFSIHSLTHPQHDLRKRIIGKINRILKRFE